MKMLTVREVAEYLNLAEMTVYRKIHNKEIPAIFVGKSIRIPKEKLDEELGIETAGDRE